VTIFNTLRVGQPLLLWEDVRDKVPYDVEINDFHSLNAGDFARRYSQSKVELVGDMRCPVWFAVSPKT